MNKEGNFRKNVIPAKPKAGTPDYVSDPEAGASRALGEHRLNFEDRVRVLEEGADYLLDNKGLLNEQTMDAIQDLLRNHGHADNITLEICKDFVATRQGFSFEVAMVAALAKAMERRGSTLQ